MHVIGELQIRHSQDRSGIEKAFMAIYGIFDLIQLTSILVFAAQLTRAFPNTFAYTEFWSPADYSLSLLLQYKTANCTVSVDGSSVTGLGGSSATLTSSNIASVFSIHTERVRVAFAAVVCGFVVSALNRVLMRANVFFIPIGKGGKLRLHKDMVTVLDLALTVGGLGLTAACEPTGALLQQFLKGCSVRSEDSVPFLNLAGMYVCTICVLVQYLITICVVLFVGTSFNKKAEPKTDEEKAREQRREEEMKRRKEEEEEEERRRKEALQQEGEGEMNSRRTNSNKKKKNKKNSNNNKKKAPPPRGPPPSSRNNNNSNFNYYSSNNNNNTNFGGGGQFSDRHGSTRPALASTQALVPASVAAATSSSYNNNNRW